MLSTYISTVILDIQKEDSCEKDIKIPKEVIKILKDENKRLKYILNFFKRNENKVKYNQFKEVYVDELFNKIKNNEYSSKGEEEVLALHFIGKKLPLVSIYVEELLDYITE